MARKEDKTVATGLELTQACNICALEPGCIAWDLEQNAQDKLVRIVEHPKAVDEGSHLFRVGDNLTAVYAVRSGAFRTYAFDSEGHEHILGFALPGDLIGFDGVYSRRHGCNAMAVQESAVCALPYFDLAFLMEKATSLREQILRLASHGFGNRVMNSSLAPEARFARFFIDLSRRLGNGDNSESVEIPMSMRDIAGYLRVTPQDVDSVVAYFIREQIISINGSRLQLLDVDRLNHIASRKRVK